ncbi:MAG: esterase-like activity of phytase family protein [Bdellovibrio sp.]
MKSGFIRRGLIGALALSVHLTAEAFQLRYVGETSIPTGQKFQKTVIGGLSGIAWKDKALYAVSDDKGKVGEPRFYKFDLKIAQGKVTLTPQKVFFITNLPAVGDKKPSLDAEGLIALKSGEFLISTEGNNNAKPREMPGVMRVSSTGKWLAELPVPAKFLPELTGQQKKGIQNNAAFEGLTSFDDERVLFVGTEGALQQDIFSQRNENEVWTRILKYEMKTDKNYQAVTEYAYRIEPFSKNEQGQEVFRGVSEILALSEKKLLVMERGVRLSSAHLWTQTIGLYVADLSGATDVSAYESLLEKKFTGVTKTKILDFETDLTKYRPGKVVQNFEGLAWGPALPDGRRSLLVMSDNNFSKKETTELLVFAVEGE